MDSMGQRLGRRLTISSAPIPRDNLDLRMSREPSLDGCDFPIWQKRHDPSALQITNDRPIAMISAECPVVDANHAQPTGIRAGASAHNAQQSIVAHRKHQSLCEGRSGTAAKRKAEMMNETFEPGGSARANGKHGLVEALGEYPSWTLWCLAAKTPGDDVKAHEPARSR